MAVQMKNQPKQRRSIESTERMLDAAEAIIAEGGFEALTVDAVITRAGTSNGSFYARFGDRFGVLAAVQHRFLLRLDVLSRAQAEMLAQAPCLQDAIRDVVTGMYDTFTNNAKAFDAFMLQTLSIQTFRERGREATRQASAQLTTVLLSHREEIVHEDHAVAADFMFRALFALAAQLVMFPDDEATGTALPRDQWIEETTRMLDAYLTGGARQPKRVKTPRRTP